MSDAKRIDRFVWETQVFIGAFFQNYGNSIHKWFSNFSTLKKRVADHVPMTFFLFFTYYSHYRFMLKYFCQFFTYGNHKTENLCYTRGMGWRGAWAIIRQDNNATNLTMGHRVQGTHVVLADLRACR